MKTKIGTVIEDELLQKLKEWSARENRTISDVLEDALINYFNGKKISTELRMKAVESFCSNPFKLTDDDWKEIMELDVYDQ